jgi:3-hydroxyacyl-CoA dehydrogenase/enoyl-CoA hydratase/3-hydroxybutyryl-CoA epimerase
MFGTVPGAPSVPPSVRCQRDTEGVATVWFDVPGKSVNAVSAAVLEDLDAVLRDLEAHPPAGVIFASAKPGTFIVGGDLFEIRDATEPALDAFLAHGQGLCDRIAALGVSTVAALSGDTLGGGYELALACRHRVVADAPRIRIGLPETAIGIIPGWGGTLRLPRLVGVEAGLDLLVTGRTVGPREAHGIGMVDEVVAADGLLAAARRRAVDPAPARPDADPAVTDPRACAAACERSRAATRARSGDHLPAALRIVDVVEISYRDGFAAGAAAERATLIDLRRGSAGRSLMRLFFLRSAAKKVAARLAGGTARDVRRAVVVGGTPAAGIAAALARAGVAVHIVAADGGSATAAAWEPVAAADLLVAAGDESLAVARDVFARLDELARPDAVLASASGSLAISDLAAATRHPERVIGLHVPATGVGMPLAEVVRAQRSAADAVATGVGIAARLGQTPIVVADAPGFAVYRVVFRSLHAAAALVDEGIPAAAIDAAARGWGMALGPLALRDAIGHDRSLLISAALAARLGDRFAPAAAAVSRTTRLTLAPDDVVSRLVDPMVDEARRVLAEGVVDSADTLDLATVLGMGFPGFRGGLATFAGLTG